MKQPSLIVNPPAPHPGLSLIISLKIIAHSRKKAKLLLTVSSVCFAAAIPAVFPVLIPDS